MKNAAEVFFRIVEMVAEKKQAGRENEASIEAEKMARDAGGKQMRDVWFFRDGSSIHIAENGYWFRCS